MPEAIKALIVGTERTMAANGSSYLKVRYSGADRIEKSSVFFDNGSLTAEIAGKVCMLEIEDSQYKGKPSTKIVSIDTTEEDPTPYVRTTILNTDDTLGKMRNALSGDAEMLKIADAALFKNEGVLAKFKIWPAAKEMHHSYQGGLLEHTYCMMRLAESIIDNDLANQGCDRGVVLTAILFHDIGKIVELDFKPGSAPQRSTAGTLLGHISVGDELLCQTCKSLGLKTREGRVLNLRHCILSHHGTKEWGSPVTPATREANLVHQIDMVQSRGQIAFEITRSLEPGVTTYSKTFEGEFLSSATFTPKKN